MAEPVNREHKKATIYITKIEAARRQIDAAIRMLLSKEDDLAIHTVAAAGDRILRDLLDRRGRNDHQELMSAGLYSYAYSLAHGQLTNVEIENLKREDQQLFHVITNVSEDIKVRGDQVTPDDVRIKLNILQKKDLWQSMSKVANFLKHADNDREHAIALRDVDNATLIHHAIAAYVMITHDPTPEMSVFYIFSSLSSGEWQADLRDLDLEIVKVLQGLSPFRRGRACLKLIRRWKKIP